MARIMLASLAAICLLIYTRIGYNKTWFAKVAYYWNDFITQKDSDLTEEQIKEERWGPGYKISMQIKDLMAQRKVQHPVLLFEPNTYLEKTAGFKMPEPIVFYYFTGIKAVWTNSRSVAEATHIVRFRKSRMYIDSIPSKEVLQQLITSYKAFPATL